MVIFRPQRGALMESMKEAAEFDSVDDMIAAIVRKLNSCPQSIGVSPNELTVEQGPENHDDLRIGWRNCKYVYFNRDGDKYVIGYCSDDYDIIPNGSYEVDIKNRMIINGRTFIHYENFIDMDKIPIFNIDIGDPIAEPVIVISILNCTNTDDIIIQRYPCISYTSILKCSLSDIKIIPALKD